MEKFINRRELRKRIVAVPATNGHFAIKHDIPGEEIVCQVPTLELAGCIVKALRDRQEVKIAERLLAKHMVRKGRGK